MTFPSHDENIHYTVLALFCPDRNLNLTYPAAYITVPSVHVSRDKRPRWEERSEWTWQRLDIVENWFRCI